VPRVDDRRVVSGVVYVIRNGLQWKDAPKDYESHKTLYNRFIRQSRLGVFDRIFAALAGDGLKPKRIMIDATHLKAHRTAASLLKRGRSSSYRAHEGRAKLQASCGLRRRRKAARAADARHTAGRLNPDFRQRL
jgi:transposase